MRSIRVLAGVVVILVLVSLPLVWISVSDEKDQTRGTQNNGVIPPDGEEGRQQAGAPERSELTREEIEKRWLPEQPPPTPYDKPPGRPYRKLVEELLKYPLSTRLGYYREVSQELPVAELYRPEDSRRNLHLLAEELVAQHDFPVLESLEKLLDRRRKEVLWISVGFWAEHDLWDNPESRNGLTAKRLLEQWASAHPDALVLSEHHPDGVARLLDAIDGDRVSAEVVYRWVWAIGEIARTGARLKLRSYPIPNVRTDVIPRLRKFADDETEIVPQTGRTLGKLVRKTIEQLEAIHELPAQRPVQARKAAGALIDGGSRGSDPVQRRSPASEEGNEDED